MKNRAYLSFQLFKLLVLCGLTVAVLAFLTTPPEEEAFLPIPVTAIAANFVIAGWIVVFHKAFRIPALECYYRLRTWERPLYERLGIRNFKRLVNTSVYGSIWGPSMRRHSGGKDAGAMRGFVADMRAAETAHFLGFLIALGLFLYTVIRGWYHMAVWLFITNIFFNAYPVMLQRFNRFRLRHYLKRQQSAISNQ